MTPTADLLVEDYLERLDHELRSLPRARRRELLDEIETHLAAGRAALEEQDEPALRALLDRLGDPAEIAADARERLGLPPPARRTIELVALIGLLFGGFVLVVGWFVGAAALWASRAWTTREKIVGTLVVPGGLLPAALLALTTGPDAVTCGGGTVNMVTGPVAEYCAFTVTWPQTLAARALLVFLVVGPVFTTVFLARRMREPAGSSPAVPPRLLDTAEAKGRT
jgi:hypothetical protein